MQTVRLRVDDPPCDTPHMQSDFCHGETCGSSSSPSSEQQHPNEASPPDACSMVAHALYVDFQLFDVVLLAKSHCKSNIRKGPFTEWDLQRLLPRNEALVAIRITGRELLDNLQHGWREQQYRDVQGRTEARNVPKTAGIRYRVDYGDWEESAGGSSSTANRTSTAGGGGGLQITEPEVLSRSCQWEPVDLDRRYRILTTRDLAQGRFGYRLVEERYRGNVDKAPTASVIKGAYLRDKFWFYATSVCEIRNPFRKPKQSKTPLTPQKIVRYGDEGENFLIFGRQQSQDFIVDPQHHRRNNLTATAVM